MLILTRRVGETVVIGNDVDRACRMLRKKVQASGTFSVLKRRTKHPAPGDRRKAKRRAAAARLQRARRRQLS